MKGKVIELPRYEDHESASLKTTPNFSFVLPPSSRRGRRRGTSIAARKLHRFLLPPSSQCGYRRRTPTGVFLLRRAKLQQGFPPLPPSPRQAEARVSAPSSFVATQPQKRNTHRRLPPSSRQAEARVFLHLTPLHLFSLTVVLE
ncbi:uncharacterized protein LOC122017173 isoform X2 [Zingiber officinale]|uniref:uncharacterized protein LOC122017173 isoform X2 n=1 Tax=Zingiber officinale TaxID=94328 RepID=UPI001C4C8110|nr:uncharacterized protein LOC122017173 isoform X2 [Zingiber officinale]